MEVSDIRISKAFELTKPSDEKYQRKLDYYLANGCLDKPIVVNHGGYLKDGYCGYLVLKNLGVQSVDVMRVNGDDEAPMEMYIKATHKMHPDTPLYWRVSDKFTKSAHNLAVGRHALVVTEYGPRKVLVRDIVYSTEPPVSMYIKPVIKCCKR